MWAPSPEGDLGEFDYYSGAHGVTRDVTASILEDQSIAHEFLETHRLQEHPEINVWFSHGDGAQVFHLRTLDESVIALLDDLELSEHTSVQVHREEPIDLTSFFDDVERRQRIDEVTQGADGMGVDIATGELVIYAPDALVARLEANPGPLDDAIGPDQPYRLESTGDGGVQNLPGD